MKCGFAEEQSEFYGQKRTKIKKKFSYNQLKIKREMMENVKIRHLKYLDHIKKHNTIKKTLLETKVEEKEHEDSSKTDGQKHKEIDWILASKACF